MTQVINDNLQVNGDIYLKADNYVSLHYGNRGRLGATPSFNPDNNNNGLWLEASLDGNESGGLFCNGETLVLWSPGDNDILRVYDEDDFYTPKLVLNGGGSVGIGTNNPQSMLHLGDGNGGGYRSWMTRGTQVSWNTDNVFFGLKDEGADRKDAVIAWGDNPNDVLRFIFTPHTAGYPDGDEIMRLQPDGKIGINTSSPDATLHINGNAQVGEEYEWNQLTIYSRQISQGGGLILKDTHNDTLKVSARAIETEKSRLYINYYSEKTVQIGHNSATAGGMELYGDLNVYGNITASSKSGFVSERFINQSGGVLEQGDVVVLGESSGEVFYGVDDNIPVPTVDLTTTTYDRRVCGIVSEILIEQEPQLPKTEEMYISETQKESPEKGQEVYEDGVKRLQVFSAEEIKQLDRKTVGQGQFGCMVTMGCFAHCKVDADIAPIAVGDLLATSSTKGYAQKVLEPEKAIGAIVGKALKSLEKGKGKIPVLVMLQ